MIEIVRNGNGMFVDGVKDLKKDDVHRVLEKVNDRYKKGPWMIALSDPEFKENGKWGIKATFFMTGEGEQ